MSGWYLVRLRYNRDVIAEVRPAHRAYMHELSERHLIGFAGRYDDESGGLFLYRASSEEELAPLMNADPYWTQGAALDREITAFDPVLCVGVP